MSDRFYKIGNTWYPWQTAHGLYGYTKTPTIRITYISTSQATWGQPESGYGFFDGDASEPQDGSYFHTSTWGWFDADAMAKTIWLMPSECEIDGIFFENNGEISPGARLIVDPSASIDEEDWRYLIASVRNLGWHTLDEWEELGWVLSDPNTLYFGGDFSGNNIRMESVDGGGGLIDKYASYHALIELRGWELGGLFIDKPRMMGICGVLTETSDSVVLVEVPKQLSVGRIEFTGSLAEGGIPESGVVEEYVPAPVLPTVETSLDAYGTVQSGTKSLAPNDIGVLYLRNASTTAVIYDDNYLYSVYRYYRNVLGASEWRIGAFFEAVKDGTALAAKNITNSTLDYIYLYRYATCSDTQAEVVTVLNASDQSFNAFKYTANGTDYYYVLDDVQTDWTDDLSSIGYHLPPESIDVFFYLSSTTNGVTFDANDYWGAWIIDSTDNTALESFGVIVEQLTSGAVSTAVSKANLESFNFEPIGLYTGVRTGETSSNMTNFYCAEGPSSGNDRLTYGKQVCIWSRNVYTASVKTWKCRITRKTATT